MSALAEVLADLKTYGLLSRALKVKAGDIEVMMDGEPAPEAPVSAKQREQATREEQAAALEEMYAASRGAIPDLS